MLPQNRSWTENDMENTYLDVINKNLSVRKVAEKYGIPRQTLLDCLNSIPSRKDTTHLHQHLSSDVENKTV